MYEYSNYFQINAQKKIMAVSPFRGLLKCQNTPRRILRSAHETGCRFLHLEQTNVALWSLPSRLCSHHIQPRPVPYDAALSACSETCLCWHSYSPTSGQSSHGLLTHPRSGFPIGVTQSLINTLRELNKRASRGVVRTVVCVGTVSVAATD